MQCTTIQNNTYNTYNTYNQYKYKYKYNTRHTHNVHDHGYTSHMTSYLLVQISGFKKTLPLWILCNDFTTIFLIFINIFSLLQLKQAMAMTFCASMPLFGMTLRHFVAESTG